jgi:hypothetical protein
MFARKPSQVPLLFCRAEPSGAISDEPPRDACPPPNGR